MSHTEKVSRNELIRLLQAHAYRVDGLELYIGDGWLPLVDELHRALARQFPHYELLAVKEKYGELAFQAFPAPWQPAGPLWSSEDMDAMEEIIAPFADRSLEICEQCGEHGIYRNERNHVLVLCERCNASLPDQPAGAMGRRFLHL